MKEARAYVYLWLFKGVFVGGLRESRESRYALSAWVGCSSRSHLGGGEGAKVGALVGACVGDRVGAGATGAGVGAGGAGEVGGAGGQGGGAGDGTGAGTGGSGEFCDSEAPVVLYLLSTTMSCPKLLAGWNS